MLFVVSFFYLDLRFLVTRASEESTQWEWLSPRWIFPKSGRNQVGKLGVGIPLPGPPGRAPWAGQHASLNAGLALQTAEEWARRKRMPDARVGEFAVRGREYFVDEWGQV